MPKPSWGGAGSGAATGASLGSALGPIGAGAGAVLGGLAGLFGGNAGKKKEKIKSLSTQTKEQQELAALINQGLISGGGPFGELFGNFNKQGFEEGVTKPALKNFQEYILPQIQEKFIAGNQVLGSGMRRGQLKAGVDLQEKLAQLMYQAQQQQQQNKIQGINSALGNSGVENIVQGASKGANEGFLQGMIPGLATGIGNSIAGGFSGGNATKSTVG